MIADPPHPLLAKLGRVLVLSDAEAAAIRAVPVHLVAVTADQSIAREGDRPARSCLVAEGVLCTSKVAAGGKRQITALHIQGDAPDLHSLHLRHLDSDIWAITDGQLAYMPHAELRRLNREHPRLGEELWRITLVDGAIYREWMVNVSRRDATSRMAHLLCEVMLKSDHVGLGDTAGCPFPLTQADLGEATGLSVVHVNRTLQALRARGLVTLGQGRLAVHDWNALAEVGDFRPEYLHLRDEERAAA